MNIVQRWAGVKDSLGCELFRVTMLIREAVAEIKAECGQNVYFADVAAKLGLITYDTDFAGLASCNIGKFESLEVARNKAISTHYSDSLASADGWVGKMAGWNEEYIRHVAESVLLCAAAAEGE